MKDLYSHYQPREASSVENKSTANQMPQILPQNAVGAMGSSVMASRPPRLLKVKDEYAFDLRTKSIAVEKEQSEIAYPLKGESSAARRGRNYSQLMAPPQGQN